MNRLVLPGSYSQGISSLAADVQEIEHRYLLHGPRHDPLVNPWMPYQPADFIGIVWECMPEFREFPPRFLDVGAGPGTKMEIARKLFGLDCTGIELDATMANEGRQRGNAVLHANARLFHPGVYGEFDLIWLYRPYRDPKEEEALESLIIGGMKPGAILAGASWETDVPSLGWQPIVDDCLYNQNGPGLIIRGAWQKPGAT